jgi:hypothetical protein
VTVASSTLSPAIAYDALTRTMSVYYDVDNRFSPFDTPNEYQMQIVADLDNQGTILDQ